MTNATRWYTTREAVKAAVGIDGPDHDALLDSYIEAGSEDVERFTLRRFIPETKTMLYRWPQRIGNSLMLRFPDEDLISVTTLQSEAQDSSPTTIASSDFFVEPVNIGPPFTRIEIDLSSSAAFASGDTPQRSISVLGSWGYGNDTVATGALDGAMSDTTGTAPKVTDSSLVGVGDTLLIESEQLFVSAKLLVDTTVDLNDTLTADMNDVTVTLDAAVKAGEVITIDSERMLIESISGLDHTVRRGYDGSVLAAHSSGANVFAPRTLTVTRGENGTTAATHVDTTAIVKFKPPGDVAEYVRAYAIGHHQQGRSGWTGEVGGVGSSLETKMFGIWAMKQGLCAKYSKVTF